MSRATELAEAEAARAEAENPDEATPDTAPDETVPPQGPDTETPDTDGDEEEEASETEQQPAETPPGEEPVTEARLNELARKRDAEDERHEKRLRQIMGNLFEGHEVCPLCLATGWLVPFEPGTFDPGQREAVEAAMGVAQEPEYREAKDAHKCETCDGWGKVLSGARRDESRFVDCVDCGALGYQRVAPGSNVTQMPMVTFPPAGPPAAAAPASAMFDPWGRAGGHPDWGRNPNEVNAVGA